MLINIVIETEIRVSCCPSFISVAMVKPSGQKPLSGGKDSPGLFIQVAVHHLEKSLQVQKAGSRKQVDLLFHETMPLTRKLTHSQEEQ